MKGTGWVAVTVTVGMVVVCSMAVAQEEGPWERPGIEAGQEIIGPDGGAMVWVPAGEFMMGITDEQAAEWLEEWLQEWEWLDELLQERPEAMRDALKLMLDAATPQRRVEMNGFWLGRHEVTNAQYRAFCEATGREFPERSDQGDDHPVGFVNWNEAVAYAEHYGLSLPTEAQWEYAARGPEGRMFPWGDEWDGAKLCWGENLGPGGRTFPVGSFPAGASWVGALDMAGNVGEWCAASSDGRHLAGLPIEGPPGLVMGLVGVSRGGSWLTLQVPSRSAGLILLFPSHRSPCIGFRCARGVEVGGE